jgi:tRNA(fMet)-specific endonuclease VapC
MHDIPRMVFYGTRYLLDTCTISDFYSDKFGMKDKIHSMPPKNISISTISVMEITYGLYMNKRILEKYNKTFSAFISSINRMAFKDVHAMKAGMLRAHLRKAGTPIGPYDLLIAATALHERAVLVTSNTREFAQVPGLITEDWRS